MSFLKEVFITLWFPLDLEVLVRCTRNVCKAPSSIAGNDARLPNRTL